jgi:branched-chain amino acid transport system substrate-binding protein
MKKMISRRNFLTAAGVVAAAGVLTACGGSSSSTAASSTAAASGDTIKIGVMGPLTGNVSVYGQAVVNGATLYLKQVNANGGINGKQIEILTEDEQGDATQAVNCFTKMVDEGITALIGDVTTTPATPFHP